MCGVDRVKNYLTLFILFFLFTACTNQKSSVSLENESHSINKYNANYEQKKRHKIISDIAKQKKQDEENNFSFFSFIVENFLLDKNTNSN